LFFKEKTRAEEFEKGVQRIFTQNVKKQEETGT
jgi:hypothetical protein